MKSIINFILLVTGVAFFLASCDKADKLPFYNNGTAVNLTASSAAIAPVAADSNKVALVLNWTDPAHATDPATYKYVIEIDSAGRNFSKATSLTVSGAKTDSLSAKVLNSILLSYGFSFGVAYDMDIRVTSSYANNNERLTSNTVRVKMTPYKIPPKVALPSSLKLFIVGDATNGGWNNPVPVPTQELARLDETTWAGVFQLTGGKQFLLLPVNGDWGHKFAVANNTVAGLSAGGDFGFDLSDNFPGPAATGWYKVVVDFQLGKFTVTPYTSTLPTNLYLVGDATAGGWNNPVPVPSQQFTRLNSSVWQLTVPLIGGKQYLLLPVNGDWSHKYAVASNSLTGLASGGEFGYDFSDNFPGPTASGTYTITVNYAAKTTAANSAGKFTVQ